MSDRGLAVSAIGAPESWPPGWKPTDTWQQYQQVVERAISCSPYDASQVASMRAGVARTQACWPCEGQQITISGPCGPPDPATVAHILAHGGDPNPPPWDHCAGFPKPLSYWQSIAQPYIDALGQSGQSLASLSTPQSVVTPWTMPGSVTPQGPPESITGPGAPVVALAPDGAVTVVPAATAWNPSQPPTATGGASPPLTPTGPGVVASPSAPGPVTGVLKGVLGGIPTWAIIAGLAAIYFLFLRGK